MDLWLLPTLKLCFIADLREKPLHLLHVSKAGTRERSLGGFGVTQVPCITLLWLHEGSQNCCKHPPALTQFSPHLLRGESRAAVTPESGCDISKGAEGLFPSGFVSGGIWGPLTVLIAAAQLHSRVCPGLAVPWAARP